MTIDPIVVLAEELRVAESAFHAIWKLNRENHYKYGDEVGRLATKIKDICNGLLETPPTSVLGASVLMRLAAERLPFAYSAYTIHFHEIADRFDAGKRELDDLVWLRAIAGALAEGLCGEDGTKLAPLLRHALRGAVRPVVVFRAVLPTPCGNPVRAETVVQ
ncbi:MAG TPA: hypothetical protein VIJ85_09185 [Rhizomicrobium sp.]